MFIQTEWILQPSETLNKRFLSYKTCIFITFTMRGIHSCINILYVDLCCFVVESFIYVHPQSKVIYIKPLMHILAVMWKKAARMLLKSCLLVEPPHPLTSAPERHRGVF